MSELQEHIEQGNEWSQEVILSLRSRNKRLWIAFVLAMILAIACVTTLYSVIPLKTVEPYVIEVDKTTGEARVLKQYSGKIESIELEEALSKYWINKYLVARESFNPKLDLEDNYKTVEALSETSAFLNYSKRFKDESPDNPFGKYKNNRVRVDVIAISFLRKDTATVRYELIEESQNGDHVKTSKLIDILNFKYTKTPSLEKEGLVNPIGFKVVEYRTDNEVIN